MKNDQAQTLHNIFLWPQCLKVYVLGLYYWISSPNQFSFSEMFLSMSSIAKTTSTSPQNYCSSYQVLLYSILCLILFHQIQHEPDTPHSQPLSNIHANANISTHNQTRPIISKAFTENPKDHHIRKITVVFWHSITRDSFTLYVEGKVEYFNHQ